MGRSCLMLQHALVKLALFMHKKFHQAHTCRRCQHCKLAHTYVTPCNGRREDVAANQIVGDPAFRRRLHSAAAPPASSARAGELPAQPCLVASIAVIIYKPV